MAREMIMGKEATMLEYIQAYDTETLTHDKIHFHQVLTDPYGNKMLTNLDTILLKYLKEFNITLVKYEFTEEEYRKYRFNPKRLSYDLYGTTELWSAILDANEISSVTEFDMHMVKLFPGYIVDRVERAINLEKANKDYNEEEVSYNLRK